MKCYQCDLEKPVEDFVKDSRGKNGFRNLCKKCRNDNERKWRKNNPSKHKDRVKRYLEKHRDVVNAYTRKYRSLRPEHYRQIQFKCRLRLRLKVLVHYGGDPPKCACCGESHIEFLTIDHIHGQGNKHRRTISGTIYTWLNMNGFPEGYRVLCWNCNCSSGFYGYCPHEEPKKSSLRYRLSRLELKYHPI